ncbi:hypothetical protein EKL99_08265 [Flavobacterium sp. ZB4P23]|uniref:hypothetical protein n=1 Tax=Flavobacterium sp. ZB4P23 TaxID=2497484 RepID=UPI000F847376|nr:hypothetical protein [Flavobacterium sp. ZB4P23]RTY82688.1 hypothetical protein EKL99_08265 [Flavobacterium sp. ZB4P23]
MKKITFLVASIFILGGSIANATEKIDFSVERRSPVDFRDADPIVFTERGIEFFIFPDGQLDFNTRPTIGRDIYYKSSRKNGVNKTHGVPGNVRNGNYGVKVAHDNMGRVRQVGNVFINYDSNDRIKRVGSVYMTYNRFALERVGGLEIIYNRHGQIVETVGAVKGGRSYQYGQNRNDRDYDNDFGGNQNSEDDDSYYYRTNGPKAKIEKTKGTGRVAIVINRR